MKRKDNKLFMWQTIFLSLWAVLWRAVTDWEWEWDRVRLNRKSLARLIFTCLPKKRKLFSEKKETRWWDIRTRQLGNRKLTVAQKTKDCCRRLYDKTDAASGKPYSEISLISNSVLLRNYKIYNLLVLFKTQSGQFFTNVQGFNFYSWAAFVTSLSHQRSSFLPKTGNPFFQLLYYTFSAVVLDFVFLSVFVFTEFNSAYSLNVRVVKET